MKNLIPMVGLMSRMYLAVFFLAHVVQYKFGPNPEWLAKMFPAHFNATVNWQDETVVILLLIIALWLIIGIRSRVVGMIGFVLYTANAVLRHDMPVEFLSPTIWSPDRFVAIAAVLALAVWGGGKWSMRTGGWRVADVF